MIKKAVTILRENPLLILLYTVYLLLGFSIMFLTYPTDMSQFTNPDMTSFDFAAFLTAMIKMLSGCIVIMALGILFLSGYGFMIAEAVITGKTGKASFTTGIKRFFVRTLLAVLLLIAISIGVSIIISITTVPFVVIKTITSPEAVESLSIWMSIVTSGIIIFLMPFIALWFPAIFLDDLGVLQGLVSGAKAGAKNYLKLIIVFMIIYVPAILNMVFNFKNVSGGKIFTPGTMVIYLLEAIASIFIINIMYLIYWDNKNRLLNRRNVVK